MASLEDKLPENASGPVFVDRSCIDCDLCRTKAPEVFTRHESGFSYVYAQPTVEDVFARTQEVIIECPVEAIGYEAPTQ